MAFWICLGVGILIGIGLGIASYRDEEDVFTSIIVTMFITFFATFILMIVVGLGFTVTGHSLDAERVVETSTTTYQLQNIGDNTVEKGTFQGGLFATYGYVDGVRKVNFVDKHDGYAELGSVDANVARIHEGGSNPHMVRHDYVKSNPAYVPWNYEDGTDYDFYVPAGTISNSFAIGNGGGN